MRTFQNTNYSSSTRDEIIKQAALYRQMSKSVVIGLSNFPFLILEALDTCASLSGNPTAQSSVSGSIQEGVFMSVCNSYAIVTDC
jgi:hypothetical protein